MTETPAQIAARYGATCPPGLRITVCPPCAYSSEDPLAPVPLRQQIAANYRGPKLRAKPATAPRKPQHVHKVTDEEREARYLRWHKHVMAGMTPTNLTYPRYMALKTLRDRPHLLRREFLAAELGRPLHSGHMAGGSGPLLESLRKAGWVERVEITGIPAASTSFHCPGSIAACWRVTDAGRSAIAAIPDDVPPDITFHTWERWLRQWMLSKAEAAE